MSAIPRSASGLPKKRGGRRPISSRRVSARCPTGGGVRGRFVDKSGGSGLGCVYGALGAYAIRRGLNAGGPDTSTKAADVLGYRIKLGEPVHALAGMLGRFGNPQNLAWPYSSERVHALSVRVRRGKPRWPGGNGARWRGLRDRACLFA